MQVCAQRRYLNDATYSGMGSKLEQAARTFHMDVVKTVRAVLAEDAGRIHHDIHAAQQFANSAARWVGELEGYPVCISRTPTHSGCIPHAQVHLMSTSHKTLRQRAANQPGATNDEDMQRLPGRTLFIRALCSGSCASLISTLFVSWFSHRRSGAPAAGTNATSHWIWPRLAHHRTGWSMRHTLTGYLIHHASSVFWATAFEALRQGSRTPQRIVALASITAATAYVVDYKVVPSRLTPGFERRLQPSDMFCIYAAFSVGLALPWLLGRTKGKPR